MVNKILKCVGVLGVYVGSNFRFIFGVSCAAVLTLNVGCAVKSAGTGNAPAAAQSNPSTIECTTDGKLTKTIDTPWGPREVYDPVQDEEVRAAFVSLYEKSKDNLFITDADAQNSEYADQLDLSDPSVRLLRVALKRQRESYAINQCSIFITSECGTWWQAIPENDCSADLDENCLTSMVKAAANSSYRCIIGGRTVFDRSSHPIGRSFFNSLEEEAHAAIHNEEWPKVAPSASSQLNNFFAADCRKWKNSSSTAN